MIANKQQQHRARGKNNYNCNYNNNAYKIMVNKHK